MRHVRPLAIIELLPDPLAVGLPRARPRRVLDERYDGQQKVVLVHDARHGRDRQFAHVLADHAYERDARHGDREFDL